MKKTFFKHLSSALMAIVFISTLILRSLATFSYEPQLALETSDNVISFRNSAGIIQQIVTENPKPGIVVTRHYLNNEFTKICTFERVDNNHVLYTISTEDTTKQTLVTISDYVTHTHIEGSYTTKALSDSFFRGNIFYNPKIHDGVSYERTLGINYELTSGNHDIYTINGTVGTAVSFIAGLIIAAFLAPLSLPWLTAFLISALGTLVVDGIIVAAFTEDVISYNSYYTIYATNVAMNHTTEHTSSAHQVDMPGRRNEYYFHGSYLPFGNSTVAYNLFLQHWGNDWTGIDRFYSAYPGMVI